MRDNSDVNWLVLLLIAVFVIAVCACLFLDVLGRWFRRHGGLAMLG
jgi:hypothetical protein